MEYSQSEKKHVTKVVVYLWLIVCIVSFGAYSIDNFGELQAGEYNEVVFQSEVIEPEANEALVKFIENTSVIIIEEEFQDYKNLANLLEAEIESLIENCCIKPEASYQLQEIFNPMHNLIVQMKSSDQIVAGEQLQMLKSHLAEYESLTN